MAGKCPYCGKTVTSLRGHALKAQFPRQLVYNAVSYQCPLCNAILGCQCDPVVVLNNTIKGVVKALQR